MNLRKWNLSAHRPKVEGCNLRRTKRIDECPLSVPLLAVVRCCFKRKKERIRGNELLVSGTGSAKSFTPGLTRFTFLSFYQFEHHSLTSSYASHVKRCPIHFPLSHMLSSLAPRLNTALAPGNQSSSSICSNRASSLAASFASPGSRFWLELRSGAVPSDPLVLMRRLRLLSR
jgi:hypothetical protein